MYAHLKVQDFNLVLLDKNLGGPPQAPKNGIEEIPHVIALQPHIRVIIVTGDRETLS